MEKESKKELTKEGFERLLTKAAQPIPKKPAPEAEQTSGPSWDQDAHSADSMLLIPNIPTGVRSQCP